MRPVRALTIVAGFMAVASISLTGCGGGGSSSDNSALVDEIMQEIGNEGLDDNALSCIREALGGYTTEELETLKNGETDADVPAELQTKVVDMMMTCIGDTN